MRRAFALVVTSWVLAACGDPPPTVRFFDDSGFFPREDSGPLRDSGIPVDAFRWPDTGPPLPTVLPAQAWTIDLVITSDPILLTVDIDARAEAGVVRGVAGAHGRAASVLFDISRGGSVLTSREPVSMGLSGDHTCSPDTVTFDQLVLQFMDADHDGTHETLMMVSNAGVVTRSIGTMPGTPSFESVFMRSAVADVAPPVVTLLRGAVLAPAEPIVLIASEPMSPAFMPRLVGPRTVYLEPAIGSSAPARWTAGTSDLPVGHYVLDLGTPRDLAGLAPDALPTLELDVAPFVAPAIDDVTPAFVGVVSTGPTRVLSTATGDVPLAGASSILSPGRTLLAFDSPAGSHQVQMLMRLEGPATASSVVASLIIFDAAGAVVGQGSSYQFLGPPSSVSDFATESAPQFTTTPYGARTAGRYYLVIEPGGVDDLTCSGMPSVSGVGITLDQLAIL